MDMKMEIKPIDGTQIAFLDEKNKQYWREWSFEQGPPVPVILERNVWNTLLDAVLKTDNPKKHPRVFRLLMRRRDPRRVVEASEIEKVRVGKRGMIRWEEGGYPSREDPLRKGGNCFIRGDVKLHLSDAWWMGREQTDLRILLEKCESSGCIRVSAWWSRGSSSPNGTDGDVWPVKLIIEKGK